MIAAKYIDRLNLIAVFGSVMIFVFAMFAQVTPGFRQAGGSDTSKVKLKLPNPYLGNKPIDLQMTTDIKLKGWVLSHRDRIIAEIRMTDQDYEPQAFSTLPEMDWSMAAPGHSGFGLDYRESSLFVPVNVREYVEFKMGRSRYVPIATLAGAAFLAQQIYSRYGYLLKKREKERYIGLSLSSLEVQMMTVLWENPGISSADWYSLVEEKELKISYLLIENAIGSLDKKFLIKTRTSENEPVRYFPAVSREELVFKLKDELQGLDAVQDADRQQELQKLIEKLEDL